MNGDATYIPIHLTLSNPQGHYLITTSLNAHETDNVDSKSGWNEQKGVLHYWEALMESLIITYGDSIAYTQP